MMYKDSITDSDEFNNLRKRIRQHDYACIRPFQTLNLTLIVLIIFFIYYIILQIRN